MTEPELLFRWRVLVLCQQHVQVIGEYHRGGHWHPWVKHLVEVPECMTVEFSDGTILEIGEVTSLSTCGLPWYDLQQAVNLVYAGPCFKSLTETPHKEESEHGDSGGWYHAYLTHELTVEGLSLALDSITWDGPR